MTKEMKYKVPALILALFPVGFFLLFAIGEGFAVGWGHYLQAAIPLAALVFAWYQPRMGGATLMALGVVAGIGYMIGAPHPMATYVMLLVELMAFVPLVISGALFELSAQYAKPKDDQWAGY